MEARGIYRRSEIRVTGTLCRRLHDSYEVNDSGCWIWQKATRLGYGAIKHDRKTYGAHCVSYVIHHGDIPAGHVLRHLCHVRACVNPCHLTTGTPRQNALDTIIAGNHRTTHGEDCRNAVLTDAEVLLIRALRVAYGFGAVRIGRIVGHAKSRIETVIYRRWWRHIPTPTIDEARQIIAKQEIVP